MPPTSKSELAGARGVAGDPSSSVPRLPARRAARHAGLAGIVVLAGALASCDRASEPRPSAAARELFTEITQESGLPARAPYPDGCLFIPEVMGSGVAFLDYDSDGDLDIFQVIHSPPAPDFAVQLATAAPDRLYEQGPGGKFTEVPGAAGAADPAYGQGVAVGDYDGDGRPDLYVTNLGLNRLYRNSGERAFRDVTAELGLDDEPARQWGSSAAFLDYDRDGDLDLFFTNYAHFDPGLVCPGSGGRPDYCGPRRFRGLRAALYRNDAGRRFVNVTAACGIDKAARGLGVVSADFTGDGWPDIYVANDQDPNHLWVNQGGVRFVDEAVARGVAFDGAGNVESGMGVATGDADDDGKLDLFVTNFINETNTLYFASGAGQFTDQSAVVGLSKHDLAFTGWGCGFVDVEHDGDLDIAVVNGRVQRGPAAPGAAETVGAFWSSYAESNFLFLDAGGGKFESAGAAAGRFTGIVECSRGLAMGDVDRDGDIDLVTTGVDNTLRLFRNDAPPDRSRWLRVRALTGARDALGASLVLRCRTGSGEPRLRVRVLAAGSSYLSSSEPVVHLGLGAGEVVEAATVAWPDGKQEHFPLDASAIRREVVLRQGEGSAIDAGR